MEASCFFEKRRIFSNLKHLPKHGVYIDQSWKSFPVWNPCPPTLWLLTPDYLHSSFSSLLGLFLSNLFMNATFVRKSAISRKWFFNEHLVAGIIWLVIIANWFKEAVIPTSHYRITRTNKQGKVSYLKWHFKENFSVIKFVQLVLFWCDPTLKNGLQLLTCVMTSKRRKDTAKSNLAS